MIKSRKIPCRCEQCSAVWIRTKGINSLSDGGTITANREGAKVKSKEEIVKLAAVWDGLYGALPEETQVLLRVMELKLLARKVGVFRIYASEDGRDLFLESKLTETDRELLHAKIPIEFYYRFSFEKGRVKITSLALLLGDKQVHFLIE